MNEMALKRKYNRLCSSNVKCYKSCVRYFVKIVILNSNFFPEICMLEISLYSRLCLQVEAVQVNFKSKTETTLEV